jgi:mannose-6-phosphate isomerase-like protein (cupin superfamily)
MSLPVNLEQKFSLFETHWQPKVIAQMNDYQFKIVKIAGDFIWHSHPETDEAFIVVEGYCVSIFATATSSLIREKSTLYQKV